MISAVLYLSLFLWEVHVHAVCHLRLSSTNKIEWVLVQIPISAPSTRKGLPSIAQRLLCAFCQLHLVVHSSPLASGPWDMVLSTGSRRISDTLRVLWCLANVLRVCEWNRMEPSCHLPSAPFLSPESWYMFLLLCKIYCSMGPTPLSPPPTPVWLPPPPLS